MKELKLNINNIKVAFMLIVVYVLLLLNYRIVLVKYFDYLGFDSQYFTFSKLILATCITFLFVFMYLFISNGFYRIVYSIYFIIVFLGQPIFYIFNKSDFKLVLYLSLPMIVLLIFENVKGKKINIDIKLKIKDRLTWFVFCVLSLGLIVPFLKNYNVINLKNLLLIDIYDSRLQASSQSGGVLGYLFAPISRVIFPFLFIYSLSNKKKILSIITLTGIIMMFLLNGAVKSVFFGLIACIFFYKGNYSFKEKFFLKAIIFGVLLSLFESIFGSYRITDYMRRLFFVPPMLFQVYYEYFEMKPTFFLHSRIADILGISSSSTAPYLSSTIPHFIGGEIMGKSGLSANVGIFVEGFFSFGTLGVIVMAIIFGFIINFINNRQLSPAYFGILFTFIYVINTSFIETLFITHGLLIYLFFAWFIIPKDKGINY
ncbi:O-antigen ligase [Schinkia azotoformans]|uniref:O-antigen polymerase n=1 Tax=Schinkia azotoformans TaxID=1454 RepID=UPI002E1E4790|nr:O-antigen ligase [Schinkia azotoformans]